MKAKSDGSVLDENFASVEEFNEASVAGNVPFKNVAICTQTMP